MYASQHVIFVGPGRLPTALEELFVERQGAHRHEHGTHAPRLLSFAESAAEAEHLANELLRQKITVLLAGPEQPPAEDSWDQALRLEASDGTWSVTLAHDAHWRFTLAAIDELTSIDWREDSELTQHGVLLRAKTLDCPVFLRAADHELASGSRITLARLETFLHACGRELRREARIRHQRLHASAFGAPTLTGDLLPLAVGVVDAIDTRPGELPGRPLSHPPPTAK